MPTYLPPLPALRAFEAAARWMSLGRAAEELHVTHGAVSHQIKFLQAHVGVQLVQRQGRGIALTPAGQRLAPKLSEALQSLARCIEEVRPAHAQRRLRVSVLPSFASKWLLPRMSGFMTAHPNIELALDTSLDLVHPGRDGVDLALRYGLGAWPGLHAQKLSDEAMLPVCSPHYRAGELPDSADAVLDCTLLSDNSTVTWHDWQQAAALATAAPRATVKPSMRFTDAALMVQAAVGAQGVALARSLLVRDDILAGRLVRLPGPVLPAAFSYYLVSDARRALSSSAKQFAAWIVLELAQSPALVAQ